MLQSFLITSIRLTCTAVKDSGEWQLEAGALVLADGGICCIDEFGSIKESNKTAIHEAMEQQTLSVAKAGLVCKLNTRCSVLAATNPKGNYDSSQSVEVNVALGSPLLSRFDLIFVLLDSQNDTWDKVISSFILNEDMRGSKRHTSGNNKEEEEVDVWSIEKLAAYIAYCKTFQAEITPESERLLSKYYQRQRRLEFRNSSRITIRLLESLIRLTQAHARLMNRDVVLLRDAIVAICLMESSIMGTGLLETSSTLHTAFPDNPDLTFSNLGKTFFI